MTEAEKAYDAAVAEIESVREATHDVLNLDKRKFHALTEIPPQISDLTGLQTLFLRNTQVTDLTPLQAISGLQVLNLGNTQVTDLGPLENLKELGVLSVNRTQLSDLRPVAGDNKLGTLKGDVRLYFEDTPATRATPELTRISELDDYAEAARQVKAYFKDLPPWTQPLPWEKVKPAKKKKNKKAPDPELPPIEAVLDPQSTTGWRWSPTHSAMVLHVPERPSDDRQQTLAQMVSDRLKQLQNTLAKH